MTQRTDNAAATGNYAPVNGLNLYYETYGPGTGTPLVLLHGGLGGTGMFAALLPALAETRRVIAVELQGHGHTADIDRPFSIELMADDIAALIAHLGVGKADVLGYSLGGCVALQTAIRHPEVLRKLIVISSAARRDGNDPRALAGMAQLNAQVAQGMVGSPPYEAFVSAGRTPEDWNMLVTKTGDLLRQDYDWMPSLSSIKSPTLLVFGDTDSVLLRHAVEMFEQLGGGPVILNVDGSMDQQPACRLAVLPGTTHYEMLFRADLLLPIIPPFLDAALPEP
jgi:pimeloyl-ACP methyl ester carboxylesterase